METRIKDMHFPKSFCFFVNVEASHSIIEAVPDCVGVSPCEPHYMDDHQIKNKLTYCS